jgi:hypothetical protein
MNGPLLSYLSELLSDRPCPEGRERFTGSDRTGPGADGLPGVASQSFSDGRSQESQTTGRSLALLLQLYQQDIVGESNRLLNGRAVALFKSDFVRDGMSE